MIATMLPYSVAFLLGWMVPFYLWFLAEYVLSKRVSVRVGGLVPSRSAHGPWIRESSGWPR